MFTIEVSGPGITATKFSCDENRNWLMCTTGKSWRTVPPACTLERMYSYAREFCREKTPHKWAEVQAAYAQGAAIQIKGRYQASWVDWIDTNEPTWTDVDTEYRVKPEPHKWAEVQAAFEEGKTIQIKRFDRPDWRDCPPNARPCWLDDNFSFRVKPSERDLAASELGYFIMSSVL